ncbi:MAG TPA: hypothetical protein VMW17_07620 [Candidatus Binatia bacterium]|nr:hypothetical protein [Candidatus Binatia bacterium]
MTFVQTPALWPGDPMAGVVVMGSAGIIVAVLLAALVGSLLGILHEWRPPLRPAPRSPEPTPRRRRPRLAYT